MSANALPPSIERPSFFRRLDLPFIIMGLFFIAMAASEYLFPTDVRGGRFAIKILCGSQIAFALIVAVFTRASALFSRWTAISFLLLLLWLCLSGIVRTENINDTLYLWVIYFYWYSLFLFFYTRMIAHPEQLQGFLLIAGCSLLIWLPALVNSTGVIMKDVDPRYVPAGYLRQNYVGYYIVALFPYVLMLKINSLKIIAIGVISFGAMYSLKRGAVFALALMGLISSFLYVAILSGRGNRARNIIALILLWSIAITASAYYLYTNGANFERRLHQASNREEVFKRSLEAIENANVYELVIGHGDRQAQKTIHAYTHNDWLFLFYDYGIISVALMINVYISLLWLLRKLYKLRSPLLLPLSSAIILMICVQLYSIGLYLKTFGLITGCIGLVTGCYFSEYNSRTHHNS